MLLFNIVIIICQQARISELEDDKVRIITYYIKECNKLREEIKKLRKED